MAFCMMLVGFVRSNSWQRYDAAKRGNGQINGGFGLGSLVLAAKAMLAPSRAARSAIAKPMPRGCLR